MEALNRELKQSKRYSAKSFAEETFPGQKTWQDIAKVAFKAGEDNAVWMIRDYEGNGMLKELTELRQYKKDMEETLADPELLSELIAGL